MSHIRESNSTTNFVVIIVNQRIPVEQPVLHGSKAGFFPWLIWRREVSAEERPESKPNPGDQY